MKTLSIYLAGNIKKGHEDSSAIFWTEEDRQVLQKQLPDHKLIFLNPATRTDDLSDQKSVFGRDMTQVYCADIVLVDARERRGLGVGAEMMWAKVNQIPVITLAPKKSHYNREVCTLLGVEVPDWIHPFIESLSDAVVDNLEEAASAMAHVGVVRDKSYIHEAMEHYRTSQYPHDLPMQELIESSEHLQEKFYVSR